LTRRFIAVALLSAAVFGLFTGMGIGVLDAQPQAGTRAAGLNSPIQQPRPTPSDTPTPTSSATEEQGPPRDRTYVITNRLSRLAADVQGASDDEGTPVILFQATAQQNQQWRLRDVGSGRVSLVSVDSGNCLRIQNGSDEENAPAETAACASGDESQQWRIESKRDGWQLTSEESGQVLDADENPQTPVLQRPADDAQNSQIWFFTPVQ
jgi:hypothetical protein